LFSYVNVKLYLKKQQLEKESMKTDPNSGVGCSSFNVLLFSLPNVQPD